MIYAVVDNNGLVLDRIEADSEFSLPGKTLVPDEHGTAPIGGTWDGAQFTAPDIIETIPVITKRQALLWLLANLSKDEDDILTAIGTIEDETQRKAALIAWKYPDDGKLHRSHPLFDELGSLLGLTSEQLDDAFRQSATL